jgi:hypothetical protein
MAWVCLLFRPADYNVVHTSHFRHVSYMFYLSHPLWIILIIFGEGYKSFF